MGQEWKAGWVSPPPFVQFWLCVYHWQARVVDAADKQGSLFPHALEVGLGTLKCCEVANFWVSASHGLEPAAKAGPQH